MVYPGSVETFAPVNSFRPATAGLGEAFSKREPPLKGTVITITSGKGGVGKTTITANLAVALAQSGKRVVCLDADIGMRKLDAVLGTARQIRYDLVDVVEGRAHWKQALIHDGRLPKLALLPASRTQDKDAIKEHQMVALCQDLKTDFDFVLIDCPAGIEAGFRNAITPADQILILVTLDVVSVRSGDRVVGLIEAIEKPTPRLIINRFRPALSHRGKMLDIAHVVDLLSLELIGIIPEEESILAAAHKGQPVALENNSRVAAAFTQIAQRLLGEAIPVHDSFTPPSIWERLSLYLGFPEMKKLVDAKYALPW